MKDDFVLPLPELLPTVEILNLGPVIDPPFSDARSWREFLTPAETKVFVSEQIQPTLTVEGGLQAANLALTSERVVGGLKGKRYELMGVGMKSLDRRTEYPLVMIYNYTDDMVLEILVNLNAQAVLDVKSERYQPAVVAAEMSRALDLVRQDGRLPRGGIDVETGKGLIVEDVNFKSPRYQHRIVDVRFGPKDRRLPTAWAIVDLTSHEVIEIGIYP